MSIFTIETTFTDKGDFMKRVERKNTKSDMSKILADFHWVLTDDTKNDAEKIKALKDAHLSIIWR
ncbi:hypothetical protein SAMN05421749_103297 [Acinetobacter marinus]|uniref:Uncharacterized protein n=1 Tax=Acinetobacter marinus TaxID=281375 RepID=A0A1G6JAV4_9GAMM|nr:hypothetical protein SAMN05421749_103297 [Acinetobacter marinus]